MSSLGLATLSTASAWAQAAVCNMVVEVQTITPKRASDNAVVEYMANGDIVDVVVELRGGLITGGPDNTVSISEIFINLDNSGGNDVMSWQGIQATTCGTMQPDFWNCDHAIGDTDPNSVICAADALVVLDGNDGAGQTPTSCTFTYRKKLESIAVSNTASVSQASGTGIVADEAACDNDLTTSATGSAGEKLCPVTCSFDDFPGVEQQCNDLVCDQFDFDNDNERECLIDPEADSTPCTTDTNECTQQHCEGGIEASSGPPVVQPVAATCEVESTTTCQAPTQCESFACDPTDGMCYGCDAAHSANCVAVSTDCTTVTDGGADDLCLNNHCDGLGDCVDDANDPTAVALACTDPTCGTAECNPATGLCVTDCFDQEDCDDSEIASLCCVTVSDCIWANTGDVCQDPDTCPTDGIDGVRVDLVQCDEGSGTMVGTDTTTGGGLYSITALSIDADCEPTQNEWAIEVFADNFVDPGLATCDSEEDDSDCDSQGFTGCDEGVLASVGDTITSLDCGIEEGACDCLVIIDEEGLDNDFRSVEFAVDDLFLAAGPNGAPVHELLPSWLINDDCRITKGANQKDVCADIDFDWANPGGYFNNRDKKVPTEVGNPWLLWNHLCSGDSPTGVDLLGGLPPDLGELPDFCTVKLPTGQDDDEGWFMLPPESELAAKWSCVPGDPINGCYKKFADGVIPQSLLDKIPNVMPIRNQDLADLVGKTCVAVVYDSDISINYKPLNANLQGARYGKFAFEILGVETPGSLNGDPFPEVLPESKSSTSLYDVWIEVLAPRAGGCYENDQVDIHDHEPDACEIKRAVFNGGLTIVGESDRGGANGAPPSHKSVMTFSIDNFDLGGDPAIDPIFLEQQMTFVSGKRYQFTSVLFPPGHPLAGDPIPNLVGRRISIQTDEGCSYNGRIRRP